MATDRLQVTSGTLSSKEQAFANEQRLQQEEAERVLDEKRRIIREKMEASKRHEEQMNVERERIRAIEAAGKLELERVR